MTGYLDQEDQNIIAEMVESYKQPECSPEEQSANEPPVKQPAPAALKEYHRELAKFCSSMNLSEEILQDKDFSAALHSMINATLKYRNENPECKEDFPFVSLVTNDRENENFRDFYKIITKYKK